MWLLEEEGNGDRTLSGVYPSRTPKQVDTLSQCQHDSNTGLPCQPYGTFYPNRQAVPRVKAPKFDGVYEAC